MPKFVEVQVFAFSELSEKAKDKAHYEYLYHGFDFDEADNIGTIKSFCDLFDVRLIDWSIDCCHYYYDAKIPNQRSVTKKQAIAMVEQWSDKIGYYLCYDAMQEMQNQDNWRHGDLKYVIDNAIDAMFKSWRNDLEYYHSIEYFAELCECNDWVFLESGEMFDA